MPALIGIVVIIFIQLVFRYEPVAYCLMEGRNAEGLLHLQKVYRKKDPDAPESLEVLLDNHFNYLRSTTTMDATKVTFKQAACGSKYRKATWICFMINFFNQQSGINAINVYANRLLT